MEPTPDMQYQLRTYQIVPGRLAEFVDAWSANVAPLRRRAGFEIVSAWTRPPDTFIWILAFPGDFEAADRAYYASAARQAIDPDPAALIATVDERMVARVL